MQRTPFLFASAALLAVAIAAFDARGGFAGEGVTYALGALLGGLAGVALYHAGFGFTGAWRKMVRERRGAGLRAQMLLIGMACAVTFPLIGYQAATGWTMHPVILPMGLMTAIGAFVFGVGMQVGGGCASGTLFTSGGGSTRMIIVLVAFIAGSAIGTHHLVELWFQLDEATGIPNIPGTSLVGAFGPLGGLVALALGLGAIWVVSAVMERRAHGGLEPWRAHESWVTGKWSLLAGAVALAIVCVGCFLLFERPWGVTAGFALWGAKILHGVGVPVTEWGYWQPGWRLAQLEESVFADRTSVMNFGIILGAMAAASLAGKFRPTLSLSTRDVATAVIGGLLMGYGARLAFGCNIGAYLSGLVSGSLHGVWWLVWGFLGSLVGTWVRGRLEMDPPLPSRPAAA
jgi:hypothetical protein